MSYKSYDKIVKSMVIDGTKVEIVGWYDEDTPKGKYDRYDVIKEDGGLIGYRLKKKPTKKAIQKLLKKVWTKKEILNMNTWDKWSK